MSGLNLTVGQPPRPLSSLKKKQVKFRFKLRQKAIRRRMFRYGLVGLNMAILGATIMFVVASSHTTQADSQATANTANVISNPLDQLSAASVAVNVARASNLTEATAVKNQADTANAELAIMPAGNNVVSKPQVLSAALKSSRDIRSYVSQANDTVASLAVKFGVTSDSIKWSNGLTSDAIKPGTKLYIPPVNGFVYTVKAGDTAQSLAQKYNANADQITAFNDAEISGLRAGQIIEIPNGTQPAPVQTRLATSYSLFGGAPSYGSNGYDYGYCTYWVAALRAKMGSPLPTNLGNASSWGYLARAYGLSTGSVPKPGAAVVTSTSGAGHVAFVQSVNPDGSFVISEMNHLGWNITDVRTFSAAQGAGYTYIY